MLYQFPRNHRRVATFIARSDHEILAVKAGDEIIVDYECAIEVGDLVVITRNGVDVVDTYDGSAVVAGKVVEINRKI